MVEWAVAFAPHLAFSRSLYPQLEAPLVGERGQHHLLLAEGHWTEGCSRGIQSVVDIVEVMFAAVWRYRNYVDHEQHRLHFRLNSNANLNNVLLDRPCDLPGHLENENDFLGNLAGSRGNFAARYRAYSWDRTALGMGEIGLDCYSNVLVVLWEQSISAAGRHNFADVVCEFISQ